MQLDMFGDDLNEQHQKPVVPVPKKYSLVPPIMIVSETVAPVVMLENSEAGESTQKKPSGRQAISSYATDVSILNIPEDSILFEKQYYPISEVASMFGVNVSLIRFWEKEFDILKPRKNRKGDRLFRPEDVKNLKLIYFLLREKKYTIQGAKEFFKRGKKATEKFEAIESLMKIKTMLLDLKAGLSNEH